MRKMILTEVLWGCSGVIILISQRRLRRGKYLSTGSSAGGARIQTQDSLSPVPLTPAPGPRPLRGNTAGRDVSNKWAEHQRPNEAASESSQQEAGHLFPGCENKWAQILLELSRAHYYLRPKSQPDDLTTLFPITLVSIPHPVCSSPNLVLGYTYLFPIKPHTPPKG